MSYTRSRCRVVERTRLQRSNQQLVNVTKQLLLLAQAEQTNTVQPAQLLDLRALCLQYLVAFSLQLSKKYDLSLGAQITTETCEVAQPSVFGLHAGATHITLFVEDNGPGIPAQSRSLVMQRFYRIATDATGTCLVLGDCARSGTQLPSQHHPGRCPARRHRPAPRAAGGSVLPRSPV